MVRTYPFAARVVKALLSSPAKPRLPAAAAEAKQCGCGWHRCGDEKRSPCRIQRLLAHPKRFPLGMPGR
jgi:hypothetical protein